MVDTNASTDFQHYPLQNITNPGIHDVLCGRGKMVNDHVGNVRFRKLINVHKIRYVKASKVEKPNVAREVVEIWRNQSPPGRILAISPKHSSSDSFKDMVWHDVGDNKARMKASQCLRERTSDPIVRLIKEHKKKGQALLTNDDVKGIFRRDIKSVKVPMTVSQGSCKKGINSDLIVESRQAKKNMCEDEELRRCLENTHDILSPYSVMNSLSMYANKTTAELRIRQFQVLKRLYILEEQQRHLALTTSGDIPLPSSQAALYVSKHCVEEFGQSVKDGIVMEDEH
eukprot:CAMPEP_0172480474 /NCGR_PEP_ID=MMETSP1066-20121228/5613_1 /TAXON_ID=671091 /ORGANISM="Coscinodiscus wailesii, Strain CCMP2513" /LENGTH=284 /DNA_ID=CAMNT_0013241795 /DNA_START=52 /DNA_END=907 /DNA_ORIENTATION=-